MTVGRTEVPLGGSRPAEAGGRARHHPARKAGAGSYEDEGEERRRKGRSKKSGRPGR